MPRSEATSEGPEDSLSLAVQEDATGQPFLQGAPPPGGFRQSVRARLSSLVLGRDSSLFHEVQLQGGRRVASRLVLRVLDSLPFQLFSLVLVIFTLFAADVANYVSAPDAADAYINSFLLASMAAFSAEILLNVACRPHLRWFPVLLDAVATASILIDVTWVAAAAGLQSQGGEVGNHAAIVTTRAGRIIRLVRVIRILRMISVVTTIASALLKRWKTAEEDKTAPSNIGSKLTDATTMQVALVVICTVIGAALLLGLGEASTAPLSAFVTVFEQQAGVGSSSAQLDPLVQDMLDFAAQEVPRLVPMELKVGPESWSWVQQNGGYSRRSVDTVRLTGSGGQAVLVVDVSAQNHHLALMDIALIIFIVGLLLLFVATLNLTAYRLLVRPLERIFATIRRNAAQIVSALEPAEGGEAGSGGGRGGGGGGGEDGDGDVGTIEAAVEKMSRIVAHFTSGGGQGAQLMKNMAQNADHATKEWLSTFVGGGGGGDEAAGGEDEGQSADSRGNLLPSKRASNPSSRGGGSGAGGADFRIKSLAGGGGAGGGASLRSSGGGPGASPLGPPKLDRRSSLQCFLSSSPKPSQIFHPAGGAAQQPGSGAGIVVATAPAQPLESPKGLTRSFLEASGLTALQHAALLAVDSSGLQSLAFDTSDLPEAQLVPYVVSMFMDLNLAYVRGVLGDGAAPGEGAGKSIAEQQRLGFTDVVVLWRFVEQVAQRYQRVPYHSFFHAVDVTHTVFCFIKRVGPKVALTPMEKLALMTAALCHDMEHPGVNNAFLVSTKAELATTYNDNSVLENRHVACLYGMLAAHPDADIFKGLDAGQWREVRRALITAVLHTDMVHHFATVSKVEVFYELHAAEVTTANKAARRGTLKEEAPRLFSSAEDRSLLLCLLLHCADIGNPLRPAHIARKWAHRVLEEFFRQGDMERAAGLPVSPMCDRAKSTLAQSQINFIEYVVAPLYVQVAKIFPELGDMLDNMQANMRLWSAQLAAEVEADPSKAPAEKAAETQKAEARLAAFLDKYKETFAKASRRAAAQARHVGTGVPLAHLGSVASTAGSAGGVAILLGGASSAAAGALFTARTATGTLASAPSAASIALTADEEAGGGGAEQQPPQQQQQQPQQRSSLGAVPELEAAAAQPNRASSGAIASGQGGNGDRPPAADAVVTIQHTTSVEKGGPAPASIPAGLWRQQQQQQGALDKGKPRVDLPASSTAGHQAISDAAAAGNTAGTAGSGRSEGSSRQGFVASAAGSKPSVEMSQCGGVSGRGPAPKRSSSKRSSLLEVVAAAAEALTGAVGSTSSRGSSGGGEACSPRSSGAGLLRRASSRSFGGANRVMPRESSSSTEEGGAGRQAEG